MMCKHGDDVPMVVWIPTHLSHTGEGRFKQVGIDRCIAPIIAGLNAAGVITTGSCCGHEKAPGEIMLLDGRTLVVSEARAGRQHKEPNLLAAFHAWGVR